MHRVRLAFSAALLAGACNVNGECAPTEHRKTEAARARRGSPGDPLPESGRKSPEGLVLHACDPYDEPETPAEIEATVEAWNRDGKLEKHRLTREACGPYTKVRASNGFTSTSWYLRGDVVVGRRDAADSTGPHCHGEVPVDCKAAATK